MAQDLTNLISDTRHALDRVRTLVMRTREALLGHYRRSAGRRTLGPPFLMGGTHYPDELPALRDALTHLGQPGLHLAAVIHAAADLSALFAQYEAGELQSVRVKAFRDDVERIYGRVADAMDAADAWLLALQSGPATSAGAPRVRRPNSALLDQDRALSSEDVADVLCVGVEAARRRIRAGEFGPVTKLGKRRFVQSAGVRAALEPKKA